ncbi:MAG TPA: hypothetical protein VHZ55_28055 [Bryobacteraceae bacterium]|nr:hypothetical protein [Bryobacteraceae bacterium]
MKKAPATLKRADFEMLVLAFIKSLSIDDFEAVADQYKVDTEKVQTDQDLADLLRKKVTTMTEQQLVRTLIELALLPFGHSYKELAADNLLVLVSIGPGVQRPAEGRMQVFLHATLDDASRLTPHAVVAQPGRAVRKNYSNTRFDPYSCHRANS